MWIFCLNCYGIMLEELERREASQRKKPEQGRGKNHAQDHLEDLEGMGWLIAAQGMKLIFEVWNWMKTSVWSQRNILKNWKTYTDMDNNPGRNLVVFFFYFRSMPWLQRKNPNDWWIKCKKVKSIVQEWIEVKEFDTKIWKVRYIISLMLFYKEFS